MINQEGAGALQYHGWLHWPVIAAAYHARQPDLMWQEVDYAFRCFSHLPKRAAGFLADLLGQISPVRQIFLYLSCFWKLSMLLCHLSDSQLSLESIPNFDTHMHSPLMPCQLHCAEVANSIPGAHRELQFHEVPTRLQGHARRMDICI